MNSPSFFRAARLGAVLLFATHSIAAALDLTFPTRNRALLQGDGEGFYMFWPRSQTEGLGMRLLGETPFRGGDGA